LIQIEFTGIILGGEAVWGFNLERSSAVRGVADVLLILDEDPQFPNNQT
jgi:hypothetical protein